MLNVEEKYVPHNIAWAVLNNLKDFNDKPELIFHLANCFNKLTEHTLFFKFHDIYSEAVKYYEEQNKFPGIEYLDNRFSDGRTMMIYKNVPFSMDMYDKLKKQLEYELILQDLDSALGESDSPNMEGCRELGRRLMKFAERNVEVPIDVKEDWLNAYDKFKENYHGISTGIKVLDEQIGDLGGIVTIAAPSGNGKSTFALSLAYNISTLPDDNGNGRNVLYISFEMTKFQLQSNLASIESSFCENMNKRLKATNIRNKELTPEEELLFKEHINSYMQRLNYSGGYISLMDNTAMGGYTTIEEFMATIEEHSNKVGKKFDIIFIDNVDSLKMLKGERGQDDMAKMNGFITKLDAFSKTYMDGYGTTVVLLSQTNREGVKKLKAMESNNSQEITIDFTVLQQYSALYERATMVLVLYSSATMRSQNQLRLMPVKLRNKPLPTRPLILTTRWEYSYVGGSYVPPKTTVSEITSLLGVEDDDDELTQGMITGEDEVPYDDGIELD